MADKTFTQEDLDAAVKSATDKIQASIDKLESKNEELVGELRTTKQQLRATKEIDPADLTAAEERAEKAEAALKEAQKEVKSLTTERDKALKAVESESGYTSKLLTENALNKALAEAGVTDPDYLAAAKSMMAGTAQVVSEGDERIVKVGDKTLADHVKEWASTEPAKKFISAPSNSGGGAPGGKGSGGGGKTMTRTEYNEKVVSDPAGTRAFIKDGGTVVNDAA